MKVENKENGKETVVRVNDRGPFVKGRIIDLSFAAAKKLGVDVHGTAPVRVEALGYQLEGKNGYRTPENYRRGQLHGAGGVASRSTPTRSACRSR